MSVPPQGGWQPQQPGGPPYGVPPGNYPQYPGQQPPGQQPPGFPQGPWPQHPPPPPKGNSTKWLLIVIALLLVIGVTIGATLLFTRDGGNDPSNPPTSGTPSDIASANDTGPVSIITDEPTCKAFNAINNGVADVQTEGWGEFRDSLGPASAWTPEQQTQIDAVARTMRNAADQAVSLARQTPHRLVRELYEQFIAYSRAYADSIPDYQPADNALASASVGAGSAIIGICNSIEYESTRRSLSLSPTAPPTRTEPPSDPADAQRFIASSTSVCTEWVDRLDQFTANTPEWQGRDGSIPASNWTPERRAIEAATTPLLIEYAKESERAGRDSGNTTFEDFAVASALYIQAYVAAGESYTNADSWLIYTGFRIANLVSGACRAVSG